MERKRKQSDQGPNVKKKPKYQSKFQESWGKEYPGIQKSSKGEGFAYCAFCLESFSVTHGGKNDVKKHSERQKHLDQERLAKKKGIQVCCILYLCLIFFK